MSARRTAVHDHCTNTARCQRSVRLVYGLRSRNHVSAAMIELWLPVEARIQFKLCLLDHLTLVGKVPTFIRDILQPVLTLSSRSTVLRSATRSDFLLVPRTRLKFGERAFSVAAKAWNNLPLHVRAAENTDTFNEDLKLYKIPTSSLHCHRVRSDNA